MNKNIMIIWGMVVVLICASLIFISNNKRDKILFKLEHDIKVSTREYIKKNNIDVKYDEPCVISIKTLIENDFLDDDENIDKYCIKTVLVTKELFYKKYTINKECNEKEIKK